MAEVQIVHQDHARAFLDGQSTEKRTLKSATFGVPLSCGMVKLRKTRDSNDDRAGPSYAGRRSPPWPSLDAITGSQLTGSGVDGCEWNP